MLLAPSQVRYKGWGLWCGAKITNVKHADGKEVMTDPAPADPSFTFTVMYSDGTDEERVGHDMIRHPMGDDEKEDADREDSAAWEDRR